MGQIGLGLHLDYVRKSDRSFEYAVKKAAALGYECVVPCLSSGRDPRADLGLSHVLSMDDDPLAVREICDSVHLKIPAVSAHSPLMRPEIAVPFLRQAIRFASDLGAGCVITGEGLRPKGGDDRHAFDLLRYTLSSVLPTAERYKVALALEPQQQETTRLDAFLRMLEFVRSPFLKVSFHTGSVNVGGQDVQEFLESVANRLALVNARDLQVESGRKDRSRQSGPPAVCAAGDGVIDWKKVLAALDRHNYSGALVVDCVTEEQAERSVKFLGGLLKAREAAMARTVEGEQKQKVKSKSKARPSRSGKKKRRRR